MLVYEDGRVCISILHPPGTDSMNSQETADERWRPILGIEAVIVSVMSMLGDPNVESPANIDASVEFRDNIKDYNRKVRRLAQDSVNYL
jgi:ubiquitin-conjugating enzyme E2 G1